jgi:hypothetical protein
MRSPRAAVENHATYGRGRQNKQVRVQIDAETGGARPLAAAGSGISGLKTAAGITVAIAGVGGSTSGALTPQSAGECSHWQTVHASLDESLCP